MTQTREIERIAGAALARFARDNAETIRLKVLAEVMTTPGLDAGKLTDAALNAAIAKNVTQDAPKQSKRLWSAAIGLLTTAFLAALIDPTLQAAILKLISDNTGSWAVLLVPLAGTVMTTLLAVLSKRDDTRPPKPPAVSGSTLPTE